VFGVVEYFRDETTIPAPGPFDVLALERRPQEAGKPDGYEIEIWFE
jgi:hypothetical protein